MKNKINFIKGETYTLSELFSGTHKIIIPDLQRDYCWGDKIHTTEKKELVTGFLSTLIEQFDNYHGSDSLSLGLIYGYEAPENHIQLCDGQQRITTLFLLLGMLNKSTPNNMFKKYLISDFEYAHDDREPYLQYSIRESSLYFLSDLVCHFFIYEKEDRYFVDNVKQIEKSAWFFKEYHLDPSIQSMIRALSAIHTIIKEKDETWCINFGDFITQKLTFMYYDMENRKNGEETFVVINTTGEPLTNTQNLKPLISMEPINKSYQREDNNHIVHTLSEDWEEIENWFWQKRITDNGNDTADAGFNEFLRWITLLHTEDKNELDQIITNGNYTFPKERISFYCIRKYWEVIKFLFEQWECRDRLSKEYLSPAKNKDVKGNKAIGQIDCFRLLPLIAYCKKWNVNIPDDRNLLRLYEFIYNLSRIKNVQRISKTLVFDVLLLAKTCRDIIKVTDSPLYNTISGSILTNEEKRKLSILKQNPTEREYIEELFWRAQSCEHTMSHHIWSGQILPLIEWSYDDNVFNKDLFEKYLQLFDNVFVGDCKKNIDDVRRVLITRKLNNYPKIFNGYTNLSFAWEWSDWQTLINENKEEFKSLFDDLSDGMSYDTMKKQYMNNEHWAEFVYCEYLLEYCHQKNIQWDVNEGWLCIQQKRATKYMSVKNLHLKNYLSNSLGRDNWLIEVHDQTDAHVIVVKNIHEDFVFKIWYREQPSKWTLHFFRRNTEFEPSLKSYLDDKWQYNGTRYEISIDYKDSGNFSFPNVLDELNAIISKLESNRIL